MRQLKSPLGTAENVVHSIQAKRWQTSIWFNISQQSRENYKAWRLKLETRTAALAPNSVLQARPPSRGGLITDDGVLYPYLYPLCSAQSR
eukprot:scaffold205466_cov34-Prasinocladus_malaysianus.AAC.2